ncbi:MAG: hypothetical protein J0L80_07205 [Chitinophagales bacterium]|nr:hypothetical protein [Chitinophagales bacterium]
MREKLRIIFLPYLLVFATILALMVGAKWYIEIKERILLLNNLKFDIEITALLAIVLSVIVLNKRMKIFRFTGKYGKPVKHGRYYYYIFIVPSIVVPVNFALNYVGAACYGLVHVKSANEIKNHKRLSRYYAIDTMQVDVAVPLIGYDDYIEGGGRGSSTKALVYVCHALLPVAHPDSVYTNQVWLGLYYKERLGTTNSGYVQEQVFNAFAANSERRIANANEDIGNPVYYENPPDNSLRRRFLSLIPHEYKMPDERIAVLCPRYQPFEDRAKPNAQGFAISTAIALFFIFMMIASTPVVPKRLMEYVGEVRA